MLIARLKMMIVALQLVFVKDRLRWESLSMLASVLSMFASVPSMFASVPSTPAAKLLRRWLCFVAILADATRHSACYCVLAFLHAPLPFLCKQDRANVGMGLQV
jgi:hypothetical protein